MTRANQALPPIRRSWLAWFTVYVRWYLRRHFHGLHLLRLAPLEAVEGKPLLLCLNHASWWDPLLALYLSQRFFPQRAHYGPMDAEAMKKYPFFGRLGFFGVQRNTAAGAATFLRTARNILTRSDAVLWVTPQGQFADVRQRPVQLASGAAHLPKHVPRFTMLPVALEYAFWNERTPEAFVCIGQPVHVERSAGLSEAEWGERFAAALESTQDVLSAAVQRRDGAQFESLLIGRAGVGGVYDVWRSFKSRVQGKSFAAEHGR